MLKEETISFLEHHGVRGMRWGYRRAGGNVNVNYRVEQNTEIGKSIAKTLLIGAGAVVLTEIATKKLNTYEGISAVNNMDLSVISPKLRFSHK